MTRRTRSAFFRFGPGLMLTIRGDRAALRQLAREYGPGVDPASAEPDVEVVWERLAHAAGEGADHRFEAGHKTVSWRVALGPAHERTLRATLELAGRPRAFGRSLLQGYVVEALLGVAAARRGMVLLPAAAFEQDGSAVVLLGRSRSGKSSLMARALAAGRTVLADDQVLIDDAGRCWSFPRRIRVYPELRVTAPSAYRRLRADRRAALGARRVARAVSRGYLGPSLAVAFSELGGPRPAHPLPLDRVVLIERGPGAERIEISALGKDEALAAAQRTLGEQRAHLRPPSAVWRDELRAAAERERVALAGAFESAGLERLTVPDGLSAAPAIAALARELRVEG